MPINRLLIILLLMLIYLFFTFFLWKYFIRRISICFLSSCGMQYFLPSSTFFDSPYLFHYFPPFSFPFVISLSSKGYLNDLCWCHFCSQQNPKLCSLWPFISLSSKFYPNPSHSPYSMNYWHIYDSSPQAQLPSSAQIQPQLIDLPPLSSQKLYFDSNPPFSPPIGLIQSTSFTSKAHYYQLDRSNSIPCVLPMKISQI